MLINPDTPQLPWESFEDAKRALREKIHYVKGRPKFGRDKAYLQHNGGNDYTLKKEFNSVWIQVDEYVVYIRRTEGAATAEIYDNAKEDPIDTAVALWTDSKK